MIATWRQPLTVIGGFLGAGKTTLVNHLLGQATGRYAVLVNDFGAVNVDAGLIADHDGRTLRLTNGCVCCSLADGFLETLLRVLAEPEPFDHIVIEASGVGDPQGIAEIALVEPGLVLDGVVVLADAERISDQLADPRLEDTVVRQIRAADIILLNKCDLAASEVRSFARIVLERLRPDAPIVETVDARLPEAVLALSGSGWRPAARFRAEPAGHEDLFQRLLYRRAGALDRADLARALDRAPASLLRLKGSVRLAGCEEPELLQMVGRRWSLSPLADAFSPATELVGIAAADSRAEAELTALLDAALVHEPGSGARADRHEPHGET